MATQEWAPIIAALTAGENLDYGDQDFSKITDLK